MKTKKAVITIVLVEESQEIPNAQIEREIIKSLSKDLPRTPWLAHVERVTVK